ncbi:MAG: DUF4350 domain-containing protein [Caldilineaceae bacterium]
MSRGKLQFSLSLLLLLLLVVFAALFSGQKEARPYDLDSAGADGLRALRLWLGKMGYTVERTGGQAFALPEQVALLFVYPNQEPYSESEATTLSKWVANGHTLVLIGPDSQDEALVNAFGVASQFDSQFTNTASQQQPLLPEANTTVNTLSDLSTFLNVEQAPRAIPFLATRNKTVKIAVQQVGRGVVWHLSLDFLLTNEQLRDKNVAALMPALLRNVPDHGALLFDTYHLYGPDLNGNLGKQITTLQEWLYRTPFGWAILFAFAAALLYLFLQGRRLGPALPTVTAARRREAAEYVMAMATLYRRAQQREAVAQHHKQRLKRGLGRSLHVNASLLDDEFVQRLQTTEASLSGEEAEAIRQLLTQLEDQPTEGSLVRLAASVDELLATRK